MPCWAKADLQSITVVRNRSFQNSIRTGSEAVTVQSDPSPGMLLQFLAISFSPVQKVSCVQHLGRSMGKQLFVMSPDMTNSHPMTKEDIEILSGSSFKNRESAFLHCIYLNCGRQAQVAWRLKLEIRSTAVRIMEDTSNCPCHSLNYSLLLHHLISSPLLSEAFHGKNFSSAIYPPGLSALHIKFKRWP